MYSTSSSVFTFKCQVFCIQPGGLVNGLIFWPQTIHLTKTEDVKHPLCPWSMDLTDVTWHSKAYLTFLEVQGPLKFAAWSSGLETPKQHQTDDKEDKMRFSTSVICKLDEIWQTPTPLTLKSAPVQALISSGVSPSHSSIRVRPLVWSTSNTAWWRDRQREREREGKNKY